MARLDESYILLEIPHVEAKREYEIGERIDLDRKTYNGGDTFYCKVVARGEQEIRNYEKVAATYASTLPPSTLTKSKVQRAMIEFTKTDGSRELPIELESLKAGDLLTITTLTGQRFKAYVRTMFEPTTSD